MSRIVVALSGRVAAGKSTLARGLNHKYGAHVFSTRPALQRRYEEEHASEPLVERLGLQNYGEHLDEVTGGSWLAEEVQPMLDRQAPGGLLVIDAVRTSDQLEVLRQVFGRKVWHVHVESDPHALAHRYQERTRGQADLTEFSDYADVGRNRTEARVPELEALADVVLNTQRNSPTDVLTRCAATLGLLPDLGDDLVDVLVGGEFGSEGKGNVAFYLAPEYDVLMRVGGPNAGHVVPTEPKFTHRSLPSGSLANPQALLLIGPGAVLNADVLLDEIRDSGIDPARLRIDPQAMLITAADIEAESALRGGDCCTDR